MRDTMPPPYPRQNTGEGGLRMPTCVFARRKGHIIIQSGTGSTTHSTVHTAAARERHGNASASAGNECTLDKHTAQSPL